MKPLQGLNWAGTAYVSAVIVAGAALVPLSWLIEPFGAQRVAILLYLGVLTQIATLMPIRWRQGLQTLDGLPLVAAALAAPGPGVAILCWLFLFDGRRPSADLALWKLIFNRAKSALEFGVPSLLMTLVPIAGPMEIPIKTIVYALGPVMIGFPLMARAFAFVDRNSFWQVLRENVGMATVRSAIILGFGGGILYLVLQQPAGWIMGIGLVGLLIAVRANMADAQTQALERMQTLKLAARALDARDPYTESHSERVADLSARIATRLGLHQVEVERIRTGGLLHDLGKLGVRDEILNKAGSLTDEEWERMKLHPDVGADLIAEHSALVHLAPLVRHHHERFDGTGYPQRLHSDEIPLGSRIIAVADAFDTITGPRVYRRTALSNFDAVVDISSGAATRYDPAVVNALREIYGLAPEGDKAAAPSIPPVAGLRLLRRRPQFAFLAAGMAVSSLGDPLTTVGTLVAIYSQTRNAVLVGAVYVTKAVATIALSGLLGAVADRWPRRQLVIFLDLLRAGVLVVTPFAVYESVLWIFPIIATLAIAEAIAQPAREAALPEVVEPSEIGAANALIGAGTNAATIIAYPLAGVVLTIGLGIYPLFVLDALTFIVAAALTLKVGYVGGRILGRSIASGLSRAWAIVEARSTLLVAAIGAFFISMTLPSLILLAYGLSGSGPQAYTLLEALVAVGILAGHLLLVGWRRALDRSPTVIGLLLMGILSAGVVFSQSFPLTAALLFIASIGNAFYTVSNRTTLQALGNTANRGALMSARFAVVQAAAILGYGIGGLLGDRVGPRLTFGLVAFGLLGLAAGITLSRDRPTKSRDIQIRAAAGLAAERAP